MRGPTGRRVPVEWARAAWAVARTHEAANCLAGLSAEMRAMFDMLPADPSPKARAAKSGHRPLPASGTEKGRAAEAEPAGRRRAEKKARKADAPPPRVGAIVTGMMDAARPEAGRDAVVALAFETREDGSIRAYAYRTNVEKRQAAKLLLRIAEAMLFDDGEG